MIWQAFTFNRTQFWLLIEGLPYELRSGSARLAQTQTLRTGGNRLRLADFEYFVSATPEFPLGGNTSAATLTTTTNSCSGKCRSLQLRDALASVWNVLTLGKPATTRNCGDRPVPRDTDQLVELTTWLRL